MNDVFLCVDVVGLDDESRLVSPLLQELGLSDEGAVSIVHS